jgi:hypothetical protein
LSLEPVALLELGALLVERVPDTSDIEDVAKALLGNRVGLEVGKLETWVGAVMGAMGKEGLFILSLILIGVGAALDEEIDGEKLVSWSLLSSESDSCWTLWSLASLVLVTLFL